MKSNKSTSSPVSLNAFKQMGVNEKKLLVFVCSMWGINLFVYVREVFERIPIIGALSGLVIPVLIIGVILYSFKPLSKMINARDYMFVLFLAFVYLSHFLLYPNNLIWLEENAATFLIGAIPFFFVGLVFDAKKHLPYMELVSIITLILGIAYNLYKAEGDTIGGGDFKERMGAAYYLLPHCLLLMITTIKEFKIWRFLFLSISLIELIGMGNRGTVLIVAICALLYLFFAKQYKRQVLSRLIIAIGFLVLFVFLNPVLDFLFDLMDSLGFSSRSLQFFVEGDFISDSNGRDDIADSLYEAMKSSPVFGYGLCGDRNLIGTYAHNLWIELLISFGSLLGGTVFIIIVLEIIRGYKCCQSNDDKGLLLVLFGYGFISLFISGSFIINNFFYLMLGYCIALKRAYKQMSVA